MSSLDDTPTCGDYKDGEIPSNKKECTSYEQKAEDIKNDETSNNNSADVDLSGALRHLHQLNLRSGTDNDYEDDKLFADPPPREDCPICMLPMPHTSGVCGVDKTYMPCCGMTLCNGCSIAEDFEMKRGNIKPWCSLCRIPLHSSDEELIKRLKERMKLNDAKAFVMLSIQRRGYGITRSITRYE